jgi:hypothetical protein
VSKSVLPFGLKATERRLVARHDQLVAIVAEKNKQLAQLSGDRFMELWEACQQFSEAAPGSETTAARKTMREAIHSFKGLADEACRIAETSRRKRLADRSKGETNG